MRRAASVRTLGFPIFAKPAVSPGVQQLHQAERRRGFSAHIRRRDANRCSWPSRRTAACIAMCSAGLEPRGVPWRRWRSAVCDASPWPCDPPATVFPLPRPRPASAPQV